MQQLQPQQQKDVTRITGFFLINLSHESLVSYYKINYQLMQNHKYSLSDLEEMIPWEREIYLEMLLAEIKERKEEMQRQQMRR